MSAIKYEHHNNPQWSPSWIFCPFGPGPIFNVKSLGVSLCGVLTEAAVRPLVCLWLQLNGYRMETVCCETGLGHFSQHRLWLYSIIWGIKNEQMVINAYLIFQKYVFAIGYMLINATNFPYGVKSVTYSHMSGKYSLVYCQGPDVKVVHSFDTFYSEQSFPHLIIVNTSWRTCGGETLRLRSSCLKSSCSKKCFTENMKFRGHEKLNNLP